MDTNYYKKYEPFFGAWYIKNQKPIGEGSFGKVYEIEREDFGRKYKSALKIITIPQNPSEVKSAMAESMDEQSTRSYFKGIVEELANEFDIMSKVKGNTNIVSYEDHAVYEHADGIGWDIFIRMELLTPLLDYVKENTLTEQDIIKMGCDICQALEVCRKHNIIHRDIKPENIFVSTDGNFKLGDFGISRTVEKTTFGLSKKGTYTYMAPEVYKGQPYNASVDIYSLGIVLYRFLNRNRTPFMPEYPTPITYTDRENALSRRIKGETIPSIKNITQELSNIVLKACNYNTDNRFKTPAEFKQVLSELSGTTSEHYSYDSATTDRTESFFTQTGTDTQDMDSTSDFNKTETLFNDKYKIIKTIGSGGMGTVYLAENINLGTKWAVKAIPKKENANFDLLAEPNILKKLNHPRLPRIIDIEQDENNLYIIEDYIEGIPLDKQLETKKYFDEATVIEWTKQLCGILDYLHSQKPNPIIYRDMKPSNIIVSADNKVKVIDFGIAREFKKDSGSDTSYMGTRGYAAPEQYGKGQTDARTDIYSLGVTMYHLLTGKSPNEPPYEFKPLRQVDSSFSEGIELIVNKCVQNDPENRYQNISELLYALENIYIFNSNYQKQRIIEKTKLFCKCLALAVCVIMTFVSATKILAERNERYKGILECGYHYLNLYQFEDAQNYFDAAVKIDKNNPEPYLGTAQILLKEGRFEECVGYLDEIANKMPECQSSAMFNYLKGSVIYESTDYETALPYLEKAYKSDVTQNDYSRDLAVCHAKLGNLSKARGILDTITSDGVTDDILNYVKGQVVLAEGNTNRAIDNFETVISITENQDLKTRSYLELSSIYKSMRHTDKNNWSAINNQIDVLERAVKDLKNEDNLIITEAMAEAYFTAKEYDLSIQKFKRLIELGYERDYIYRNIAIIYQQIGDFSEAEDTLLTMKEKYPDNYQCYLQLAYLYMDMEGKKSEENRDYSEVLEQYNLAVQFAPNGQNTSEIIQLTAKINELKSKGWL